MILFNTKNTIQNKKSYGKIHKILNLHEKVPKT